MKNKLDTQTSILIACAAVIVIVGAYLLSTGSGASTPTASSTPATTTPSTASSGTTHKTTASKPSSTQAAPKASAQVGGVGSLNELVAFKQSLSCSFATESGTRRSGTLYIAGGELRANFTDGMSMINDGLHYYAWENGATTGLKLSSSMSVTGSVLASHGAIDPTASLSYACNPWTTDASVFAPPASVTFTNSSGL